MGTRATRSVMLGWVAGAALAGAAAAQDFGGGGPGAGPGGVAKLLESGLPTRAAGGAIEALTVSRFALPGLGTRAVALGEGWRSLRAGVGLSQSGDAEIGWSAAGAGAGVAGDGWGVAVRALVRRDRQAAPSGADVGGELGAGAWLDVARRATAWASAPQLASHGAAPPLARGLAIGVALHAAGARAWFENEAGASGAPAAASHRAGLALETGPMRAWVEARDGPLRATVGMMGDAGRIRVSVAVDSHPVLGETLRLAVALRLHGARDGSPSLDDGRGARVPARAARVSPRSALLAAGGPAPASCDARGPVHPSNP